MPDFSALMRQTLDLAKECNPRDIPVSAAIFMQSGELVSYGVNSVFELEDPLAHAEVQALRGLGLAPIKFLRSKLLLVVTLEPCPMCAWVIRSQRIPTLVFGSYNPNYGAAGSVYDLLRDGRLGSRTEVVGGVDEELCNALLASAFNSLRHNKQW